MPKKLTVEFKPLTEAGIPLPDFSLSSTNFRSTNYIAEMLRKVEMPFLSELLYSLNTKNAEKIQTLENLMNYAVIGDYLQTSTLFKRRGKASGGIRHVTMINFVPEKDRIWMDKKTGLYQVEYCASHAIDIDIPENGYVLMLDASTGTPISTGDIPEKARKFGNKIIQFTYDNDKELVCAGINLRVDGRLDIHAFNEPSEKIYPPYSVLRCKREADTNLHYGEPDTNNPGIAAMYRGMHEQMLREAAEGEPFALTVFKEMKK